ncbi:hypothetical protein [Nocardioides yefusunii]|uniref:Acetone carboxylase n=1 Tax=Nocardioides yefusunii TaxID=2500546 RepID=A0ABW1QV98_9ACTN|nr:hypothetical protein [Nocardioides yefusunii]
MDIFAGLGTTTGHDDVDPCSAKGCTAPALHALLWNNPKIHTPERRKTWLACDEHRVSLSGFLTARGFLKDVVAHPTSTPAASPADA